MYYRRGLIQVGRGLKHDGRDLGILGCAYVLWEGPCFTVGAWCKVGWAWVLWERPVHYGKVYVFLGRAGALLEGPCVLWKRPGAC